MARTSSACVVKPYGPGAYRLHARPRRSGARNRTLPGPSAPEQLLGDTEPAQPVRGDPVDREDDRSLGVGVADAEVVDVEAPLGQLDAEPTELHTVLGRRGAHGVSFLRMNSRRRDARPVSPAGAK